MDLTAGERNARVLGYSPREYARHCKAVVKIIRSGKGESSPGVVRALKGLDAAVSRNRRRRGWL